MTKRSSMLACLSAAVVLPMGLLTAHPAQAAPISPFLYEYRGDRTPDATDATDTTTSPTWSATTVGTLTDSSGFDATTGLSDPGYLRIESSAIARPRYTYSGDAWNISSAFTIEMRAKVVRVDPASTSDVGLELIGGDDTGRFLFLLGEEQLQFRTEIVNGTTLPGFDPTAYNIYRITGEKVDGAWAYSVYINDRLVVDREAQYSSAANSLFFGDSSTTKNGGTSEIDYIRWNNQQAVAPAPVPEPASAALIAVGGVLLLGKRRSSK